MLLLSKPSEHVVGRFLGQQARLNFTYAEQGATATQPPAGAVVDRTRVRLGEGAEVFDRACGAVRRWEQFRLGWCAAVPDGTPLQIGATVAVVAHYWGVWWLNACRIVYVVDEQGQLERFGFAYGTLPAHLCAGEERFLIEWDHADDSVWYDILAFSRLRNPWLRVGFPVVRRAQKRFAAASAAVMRQAARGQPGEAAAGS